MIVAYVGALVLSLGILALQLFSGHDGDGDVDAGGDVDAAGDFDSVGDIDGDGALDMAHDVDGSDADADADGDAAAHADGSSLFGVVTLVASLRFWSFGLLAFGLLGTLMTLTGAAGAPVTLASSIVLGAISGFVAAWSVRRLMVQTSTSHATSQDVVGRLGRVIVPADAGAAAKVRIEVKGERIDRIARSQKQLRVGDTVVVEEIDELELRVSPAPEELKLGD